MEQGSCPVTLPPRNGCVLPDRAVRDSDRDIVHVRSLNKGGCDPVAQMIGKWSAGPSAAHAHPTFFHDLRELAKVVEDETQRVGFLIGFVGSTKPKSGYAHLVGIHPEFERRGMGRLLLRTRQDDCRADGWVWTKSIAMPGNEVLMVFYQSLGWNSNLFDDYAGPSRPRIVFEKRQ
jgi:GNAT superfamily N-acetyltransferase